jgi:hypothetical protein
VARSLINRKNVDGEFCVLHVEYVLLFPSLSFEYGHSYGYCVEMFTNYKTPESKSNKSYVSVESFMLGSIINRKENIDEEIL